MKSLDRRLKPYLRPMARMCGKTTNLQGCLLSRTQLLTKSPMNILCTQTHAPDTLQSGGNCTRSRKTRQQNTRKMEKLGLRPTSNSLERTSQSGAVLPDGQLLVAEEVCMRPHSLTHSLTHVGHPRIMDEVTLDVKAKWQSCLGECLSGKQSFHFLGDETKVHSLQPTV